MRRRLGPALLISVLAATTLVACGSNDAPADPAASGDGAGEVAAALVQALGDGDISALPFTRGTGASAQKDYGKVVAGLGDLTPAITLAEVVSDPDDPDAATATLAWSWPLTDADTWAYDAPVDLTRTDGDWQVVWGHQDVEPSLNAASVLEASAVAPTRGDILGGDDKPIVTDREVVRVGLDRTQVPAKQAQASAREIARLTGIDVGSYVAQVAASGPQAFIEAITYRANQVPPGVGGQVEGVKGGLLLDASAPLAPTKEFAAPILGTVGPVTAEMVKDHPDLYAAGDVAGLSGLQARYDEQLRGTAGVVVNAVGSDGKERQVYATKNTEGAALHTTLDERLELRAEALLKGVGPASALVAIKPSTGAILAAANGPGNGGQNLATFGQYAPGSTFKSVSSLALLRTGLTPDTPVDCTTSVTVDGKPFENYDDYPSSALGRIPLRTAVANSCNTAFISQRGKLGPRSLVDAAGSLGLGIDHAVGFPAYFGNVEPASGETEAAADMIGQGKVLASPMAMAAVIASIEKGSVVVPQLVTGVPGLETDPPAGITPLTTTEDTQLKALLRGVVTDGSGRALLGLPGPPVIAKTGTAEFEAPNGQTRTHAWMIAAQGDLAVAVFVDEGASGSGTAGPILEAFLRAAR